MPKFYKVCQHYVKLSEINAVSEVSYTSSEKWSFTLTLPTQSITAHFSDRDTAEICLSKLLEALESYDRPYVKPELKCEI